ncbi:hypothetical protein D3C78_1689190 [compost metagenome]
MFGIRVFNVTDGAWQTLYECGDAVIALAAQTGWPVNGRTCTDFLFPLRVGFRQIAGEHERGA